MRTAIVPTRGWLRLLRGTTVAATSTLLAVLGHASAGGAVPDAGALVVLGALMAVLMTALADRRATSARLFGVLGAAQLFLHGFLQVMPSHPVHPDVVLDPVRPLPMVAVHVVTTILSAALLAHAENLIFLVAAALARITPRRPRLLAVTGAVLRGLPMPAPPVPVSHSWFANVVGRRGPPLLR